MVHSVPFEKEKNSECKMNLFLRRWSPWKMVENFVTVRLTNSYVDTLEKNYLLHSEN